ncbi:ABC transporter substrate-binding protein [Stutzerimonas frequens]|jgi:NitT/TauT family transport system substrate-binding protein|uniref:ABC transporter substrate-binding protein n=1 Tax=Stutzerimonas frequens TaxID=2968969 RepID=UPI0012E1EF71|nr:ABC transporter substrate-binding protein [Stutzerimonas frequens]MUT71298.1 nitrate ABC transporter substrate-binding protein [Stutzerimonas frequens]QTF56409.1 ABC transporter substrate-binding protein [Stutzerimonas frequens]WRW26578.1 ABC transporter substrate-binding protein [Stutzerimonas frequens]
MVRGSILLLLFVALLGCQPESDSIRIGSNRWLGYAPIYLADDLGWTAPSGIRLVEYPNTTGVLRGFRNGMLDAAMLTLDETLLLQDSAAELDLEIILVTNVSAGADALFARAPLTNLKDLAGQRIGVENTALGAYFLSRVLDQAGLRIDDLQVVSLPVHEQAAAFAAGDVDAVITFASEGPTLESKGARRIFDSRRLPGEIVDVLVVDRQRVTREQRRRLRALWFDALRTWQDNRGETDPRLHARLGLTPMALQVTLDGLLMGDRAVNREWFDEGQLQQSIGQLSQYLRERRLLNGSNPVNLIARCEGRKC